MIDNVIKFSKTNNQPKSFNRHITEKDMQKENHQSKSDVHI